MQVTRREQQSSTQQQYGTDTHKKKEQWTVVVDLSSRASKQPVTCLRGMELFHQYAM